MDEQQLEEYHRRCLKVHSKRDRARLEELEQAEAAVTARPRRDQFQHDPGQLAGWWMER